MNKINNMKALVLSLAMALGMLLPMTTNAQSDGFFRGSMDNYDNRTAGIDSDEGAGISNWGIGEEVPLGSGLLVLAAAGAGYALARRKRNYKTNRTYGHGAIIIIAFAMIITMSNCKKNVETISDVASNGIQITLDVDGGSKVIVNPTGGGTFATVTFEDGDIIYVGNNGHYCGYLQHNGTYFTGSIDDSNLSTSDYLHFYFMGNKGTTSQPSNVSITDQTSKYPVISYAHSKQLYNGAGSYTAKLENYCAIAKFTLSGSGTNNDVYVRGMYNTVTVNFAANNYASSTTGSPYSFSKGGNGTIKLHSESATEKWAILLEQTAVTADLLADGFEATTVSVPAITSNTYHASDISSVSLTVGSKVCYSFTVDDKGSVVRFSPGNLQYNKTNRKYSFMENQLSTVESTDQNIGVNYENTNIVSLFGWGNWGYGKDPLNTSHEYDDYQWSTDFQGTLGDYSDWFTLSFNEWQYLLNSRTNASHLCAQASIDGKYGFVFLPDNWTFPSGISLIYGYTSSFDATDWAAMESAGALFLPCAGERSGYRVYYVGDKGYYWSSTSSSDYENNALCFGFGNGYTYPALYNRYSDYGQSVRLVR